MYVAWPSNSKWSILESYDGECGLYVKNGVSLNTQTVKLLTQKIIHHTLPNKYLPKATAIADVTDAPTMEDFNNLLTVLRNAGFWQRSNIITTKFIPETLGGIT